MYATTRVMSSWQSQFLHLLANPWKCRRGIHGCKAEKVCIRKISISWNQKLTGSVNYLTRQIFTFICQKRPNSVAAFSLIWTPTATNSTLHTQVTRLQSETSKSCFSINLAKKNQSIKTKTASFDSIIVIWAMQWNRAVFVHRFSIVVVEFQNENFLGEKTPSGAHFSHFHPCPRSALTVKQHFKSSSAGDKSTIWSIKQHSELCSKCDSQSVEPASFCGIFLQPSKSKSSFFKIYSIYQWGKSFTVITYSLKIGF